MSQNLSNKECFEKHKFSLSMDMPHPIYKDTMYFEGLCADYVSRLERENEFLKQAYERLREKLDWMTTQEMYRLKDQLKEREKK